MPDVKIVGIDCEGSIVAHYAKTGEMIEAKSMFLRELAKISFRKIHNFDVIDDWVVIGDKESFIMTRRLLKEEAIYAGGSAGAAIVGAIKYAKTLKEQKRFSSSSTIVVIDMLQKIYNDDWMSQNGYTDYDFNVQISQLLKERRTHHFDPRYINDR